MKYVDLGTTRRISKVGLGTAQFGSPDWGYGTRYDAVEASAIVRRALDLGVTLFDTGEIYGAGTSERILGRALGERREEAFVATKIFPVVPGLPLVRRRAAASAVRLATSRLDLYQVHWPNPLVRDATTMRGMRALQNAGLVGEVGVSKYSLRRWRSAEAALGGRVLSNQVSYNLVDRAAEAELIPFAEREGRLVIAFAPLAQGLLSGNYHGPLRPSNRARVGNPLFDPAHVDRTQRIVALLREIADARHATLAQVALAWTVRSPAVVAIPGASSVAQLEENVAAADLDLAPDESAALDTASAAFLPVPDTRRAPQRLRSQALQWINLQQWKNSRLLVATLRQDRRSDRPPAPAPDRTGRSSPPPETRRPG